MAGKYKGEDTPNEVYDVTSLGHGLRITDRKKVNFTHTRAVELLNNYDEFPGDRVLKEKHVDNLITAMKRGTFRPELVTIVTCDHNGHKYRMNGQHSAWARLEMSKDYPCQVDWIEYRAQSEEDVRILYSSIDRASPRTRANVIDSYLVGTEEFKSVPKWLIRQISVGFSMWYWPTKHERGKYDGDDVAYLLKTEYYDLAMKVGKFVGGFPKRETAHINRAPVIAAMFATFCRAPEIAKDFWRPVCDGVGFDQKGDPRNRLRTKLLQLAVDSGSGSRSGKQGVSAEYMYRMCITAWNAYRAKKSVQYLRPTEGGRRPRVK